MTTASKAVHAELGVTLAVEFALVWHRSLFPSLRLSQRALGKLGDSP
ncbi:MAG: hypothetical protein M3300_02570 [Actinomycetota bacterium]|nr:hypothetical protein [Actinomycetota bacterium]